MKLSRPITTSSILAAAALLSICTLPVQAKPFAIDEATVDSIHAAFKNNTLTCTSLVKRYLARIDAYDQQGPTLRSLITVNPQALAVAAKLDQLYKDSNGKVGPLHCIPVILKDNFNTQDMATSGGNVAMLVEAAGATAELFGAEAERDEGVFAIPSAQTSALLPPCCIDAMFSFLPASRASPPGRTCQALWPSETAKTRNMAERGAIFSPCQVGVCDSGK